MPSLVEALSQLVNGLRIAAVPAATPGAFELSLPSHDGGSVTSVVADVVETVTTELPIDITWVTKGVRFSGDSLTDHDVVGGQPLVDATGALPVGVTLQSLLAPITQGPLNPPGIPGLLGGLSGAIHIPMQVARTGQPEPVTATVTWRLLDEQGQPVVDARWSGGGATAPATGPAFTPSTTPTAAALTEPVALQIPASILFTELTTAPPLVRHLSLQATVQLTAGGMRSGAVTLPPVPLVVPTVPVPTMALFFGNPRFDLTSNDDQAVLFVLLPAASPLPTDLSGVTDALDVLARALDPLGGTFPALQLLLSGGTGVLGLVDIVASLRTAATLHGGQALRVDKADAIADLHQHRFWSSWFDLVQATPEDVIGSIVLIGPPRRQLRAFNDKNLLSGQGELDLTCGEEMVVEVADLGTTAPTSVPSGRVTVPVAPQGSYGLGHHVTSFSDEISSLTLGWA